MNNTGQLACFSGAQPITEDRSHPTADTRLIGYGRQQRHAHLIVVLGDVAADLGRVNPRDKVLHGSAKIQNDRDVEN